MGQLFALLPQVCLRFSSLRDINRGTDIAKKSTVRFEARNGVVKNPAILAVKSAQAVFDRKIFARGERSSILFRETTRILRMQPLDPAIVKFLIECAPG